MTTKLDSTFNRPFIPAPCAQSTATTPSAPILARGPPEQTGRQARSPEQRHTHLQAPVPTAILRFMEPQIAFDTHAFVKRLTGAGMPENQAEIIAWGQARRNEHLATQPDLKALELTLKNDLEKFRAELKHDLEKVRAELETVKAELKNDIETVKAELKNDIEQVRAELETAKAELKNDLERVQAELKNDIEKVQANLEATKTELKRDIHEMEHKLTIKLGAFLAISVTILAALIKFF